MNTKSCNASSSVDFVGALENGEVSTTKRCNVLVHEEAVFGVYRS